MKNKISSVYPNSNYQTSSAPIIYVADFSVRTNKERGVEIHDNVPSNPNDESQDMDCLQIHNEQQISIDFNIFDDHQFKNEVNEDIEHCECCLFPSENNDKSWLAFIEIKDCKAKNISVYKEKTKNQIISTVNLFRQNNIIAGQKIYGIISMPRKKISFNDAILGDIVTQTALKREYHILFHATNQISIDNEYLITPIL